MTCPRCGLPVFGAGELPPPEVPTCNPLRSPDCWRTVANLPKAGSPEAQIIRTARKVQG